MHGRLDDGTNESSTKRLMFQVLYAGTNDSSTKHLMFEASFFSIIAYRLRALKTFYSSKNIKNKKINLNNFSHLA